ncbi:MAG: selenocysteine-specific translation elongation factor [Deltaproteobacteria bacterium]|nr:selenocysteine-specific translation elongation factor [Deltaproteobacteria bacterium]
MKRVILGTAGHIDHGKTQLVKALTGIDTDRLKEEKERGISIELGFAYLDLGSDVRIGIVDVPGHERFVRQMVAGSGGVDIAALVVALDEGVMPQTVEHLDILCLLGIKHGLVVLTKLDLVDEELALLAEEDAKDLVKGTFLENAPMVRVSARTGEGIEELKRVILELSRKTGQRSVHGLLRLPVDRVFSLKGHGTVVAGTLISGTISTGDEIEILPQAVRSSVRSIESHKQFEQQSFPGERVAVNLRGIEQDEAHRGNVITHAGEFRPSYIVDVRLTSLNRSSIKLTNLKKVRLHHYTTDVEATIAFPDRDLLEPGEEVLAQLRTSAPIVPATGDRFVIRAISPSVTLGGGVILNPRAPKLRARSVKTFLESEREDDTGVISSLVKGSGVNGLNKNELLGMSAFSASHLDKTLDKLRTARMIIQLDSTERRLVHRDFVDLIEKKITDRLAHFHMDNPLKEGISKQELRSLTPGSDRLFKVALDDLISKGFLVDQGDTIRVSTHKVRLKDNEKSVREKLFATLRQQENSPPLFKELAVQVGADLKQVKVLLSVLEKEGKIVKIKEEMYFSTEFIKSVKEKLIKRLKDEGSITPSKFQEITKSSRKYNIPLLEYFDREKITLRIGDQRVLRGAGNSTEAPVEA